MTISKKDLTTLYEKLQSPFKMVFPESENATYSSLLNYSDEKSKSRQRWYRYKEGYSVNLVNNLIEEYNRYDDGVILDPFLGSGSTIIAANSKGLKGMGFEVNPFSHFLSKCKLRNYTDKVISEFRKAGNELLEIDPNTLILNWEYPKLSIAEKVFNENIVNYFMGLREWIDDYNGSKYVKDLLLLAWLSSLEEVSNYRKAGNGLKKRTSPKTIVNNEFLVNQILAKYIDAIYEDIFDNDLLFDSEIYLDSALNMDNYIHEESISGVIFSPPYANSFDYTEIYKLELWFGRFVESYEDLKGLRNISLRSHLNGLSSKKTWEDLNLQSLPELERLLRLLSTKELWDKKIPTMIALYFHEMFTLLEKIYISLKKNGFCSIVVGNSSYGGIIFPTDLMIAKYAQSIGFTVDKIEVDRYIITSSQQYSVTFEEKRFLRESVICLVKK